MSKKFQLEILASDHPFYKGDCESLVFPGLDGEHGILADHESMVSCLSSGELRFKTDDGWQYAAVSNGFIEIIGSTVIILADTVELPGEIDQNRANEAKLRAEERMRQKTSIQEYYYSKAALNRAMARLKITNKHTIN